MTHTTRFQKLAQLLFTSTISDEEKAAAKSINEQLKKIEVDMEQWLEGIQNNLDVFNNYHGSEKGLVVLAEKFEEIQKTEKEKYERIMFALKQSIDKMNEIKDLEMAEIINNLTKTSEEFTKLYNELSDLPVRIGEEGFNQKFKEASQKVVEGNESFFEVLRRTQEYVMRNILGEQALT